MIIELRCSSPGPNVTPNNQFYDDDEKKIIIQYRDFTINVTFTFVHEVHFIQKLFT